MPSDTITPEITLERIGQISGFLFSIPGVAVWLYVLPDLMIETRAIEDTFDYIYFIFGVPILLIFSSGLGGISGTLVGRIFPKHSRLAAFIGGFLVAFFLSFGMVIFWYIPR